jgi:flavin-binding protein dodecin
MTDIANIIELVGSSDKSWEDAAQVGDMTAKVDPNTGNIIEYHTAIKLAFGVKH